MSYNKCKDCKSECPIDAECITCYNYSNFETKEKKMSDIKLTEKALKEIWDISGEFNFKDTFIKIKEKGWIEKPKTAREELEELYKDIKDNHEFGYKSTAIENVDKIFNLAIKAIEEAK